MDINMLPMETVDINVLPSELIEIIFDNLNLRSLLLTTRVCRLWRVIFKSNLHKYKLDFSSFYESDKKITDDALSFFENIRNVNFMDCGIIGYGFKNLTSIEKINLSCCKYLVDEGLKYLCENNNILKIDISCTNITDEGLKYLENVPKICMEYCKNITDEGLKYLKNVHTINLSNNDQITNIGLANLRLNNNCINKIILEDNENIFLENNEDLQLFSGIPNLVLNGIVVLNNILIQYLKENKNIESISVSCIKAKCLPYMTGIPKITVRSDNIKDSDLIHLKGVKELDVSFCKNITDDCLVHIIGVEKITTTETRITDAGREYLRQTGTKYITHWKRTTDSLGNILKGAGGGFKKIYEDVNGYEFMQRRQSQNANRD